MAAESRRESAGLTDELFREAQRFDFFQAVRLLEWVFRRRAAHDGEKQHHAVGQDNPPDKEIVRFRAQPSLSFPASDVSQLRQPPAQSGTLPPPELSVAFLGLTGPSGVMPFHYTTTLLWRTRAKDHALREFFDLFNHRLISLFYRAWQKYRLPFAYEWALLDPDGGTDVGTQGLFSLVGLGTGGLRRRLEIDDQALLFYGGHFAHFPRSALALELILSDYFAMPVTVEQLHGQWLVLERSDQARLPNAEHRNGLNNRLGVDLVAGERVWDVQSKFRLRLGPLTYVQFRRFMPNGNGLRPLCQLTRTFVGPELSFDVQLTLQAAEVPWCRLGGDSNDPPYLGWNTWVRVEAFRVDATDAVFAATDV
jgi:type VI secretion system protein ImpH